MCESDEIRILLKDPHEFGEIDGAWGAGVARLAEDLARDPAARPRILTEPRLRTCIETACPGLPLRVSPVSESHARIARAAPASAAYLDLLFLRGSLADPIRARRIRSYGLRAAILGCVLARELGATHTATLADPFDEAVDPPDSWRLRAWIRFLEAKVAANVDEIETPDEESAHRLREIVLPIRGEKIRASRATHSTPLEESGDPTRPARIAVEASTRSAAANRLVLRALRAVAPSEGGMRIHWLAPRSGMQAMRARQDIRRWDLARHLCWEDEPWIRPPHLRKERWKLLIRADPRPGARPLHVRVRAGGTAVVVPATPRANPASGDSLAEWTPRTLCGAVEGLTRRMERR